MEPVNPESGYEKIKESDGLVFFLLDQMKANGLWMCDSADHNPGPCSNPVCFKFKKVK